MAGPRTPNSRSATARRANGAARTLERLQRGLALHQAGRLGEAIPIYEEILARAPTQPDACHLLGVIRLGQGNTAEAVRLLRIAARGAPGNPQYAANLVAALNAAENYLDAVTVADRLVKAHPTFAGGWNNRGMALKGRGALQEAVASYRRAVELQPDYPPFGANLGNALRDSGDIADSIEAYQAVLAIDPEHAPAVAGLARSFFLTPRISEMIATLYTAPTGVQQSADWHFHLGRARQGLGELAAAEQSYDEAIRIKPDFAEALHARVLLRRTEPGAPVIGQLQAIFESESSSRGDRIFAAYALGWAFKDTGAHPHSVDWFEKANELLSSEQEEHDRPLRRVERTIQAFDSLPPVFEPPELDEPTGPIFVMGLSRSGKTTVERFLTLPDATVAGGEMHILGKLLAPYLPDSEAKLSTDPAWIETLAARYELEARRIAGGTGRLINTMPPNLLYVPYIVRAMPNARIVNCVRDTADHTIALYEKYLTGSGYEYASAVERAMRYIEAVNDLWNVWRRQFPDWIIDIDASTLASPMVQHRLLAHCGLPPREAGVAIQPSEPRLGIKDGDSVVAAAMAQKTVYLERYPRLARGNGAETQAMLNAFFTTPNSA